MRRRDFLTSAAALGTASTAVAQPKPVEKADERSEADALLDIVRRRYGARLTAEQLATIHRQVKGNLQAAAVLAAAPLANGDGPLLEPSAFYHSRPEPK